MFKAKIEMFEALPAADPEEWWKGPIEKRFPVLAILARDFLPVTATEAPSERVFSGGGQLVKNGGHRSGEELLKSRTFLASANEIYEMLAVKKHKSA